MAQQNKRRWRSWLIRLLLAGIAIAIYLAIPGKITYTVGPETTVITEPAEADGWIDFSKAVNDKVGNGITPDTNAMALLVNAFGPLSKSDSLPPEYYRRLQIQNPPAEGNYFRDYVEFFRKGLNKQRENDPEGKLDLSEWESMTELTNNWVGWAKSGPWKRGDAALLAAYIDANEIPLKWITNAAKRPHFFYPLPSEKSRDAIINIPNMGYLARLRGATDPLVCRAMLHLGEGRPTDAWNDLYAILRLGRLAENATCGLQFLTAIGLQVTAVNGIAVLLEHAPFTVVQLQQCQQQLRELPPRTPLSNVLAHEQLLSLNIIQYLKYAQHQHSDSLSEAMSFTIGPGKPFSRNYDLTEAMKHLNSVYSRLIAAATNPDYLKRRAEVAAIVADVNTHFQQQSFWSKVIGSSTKRSMSLTEFLSEMMRFHAKLIDSEIRMQVYADQLQILFALKAYRLTHGKYPQQLANITGPLINDIPPDRFTNQPLRYDVTPTGFLLYSIGPNQLDEHGIRAGNEQDDIPTRIPNIRPAKPQIEPKPKIIELDTDQP